MKIWAQIWNDPNVLHLLFSDQTSAITIKPLPFLKFHCSDASSWPIVQHSSEDQTLRTFNPSRLASLQSSDNFVCSRNARVHSELAILAAPALGVVPWPLICPVPSKLPLTGEEMVLLRSSTQSPRSTGASPAQNPNFTHHLLFLVLLQLKTYIGKCRDARLTALRIALLSPLSICLHALCRSSDCPYTCHATSLAKPVTDNTIRKHAATKSNRSNLKRGFRKCF